MILLIGDDAISRTELAEHLRASGHEVLDAPVGKQALLLLKDIHPFHVVIVDFGLPDVDGRQFLESIRQLIPHVPLILMSGYLDHEAAEAILTEFSAGAKFLPKPVRPTALELTVQSLLS